MSTDVSMPDRLVVLTFDDAVSNHASFVAPILKRYGFGATFYICEMAGDGGDCFEKDKRQYMTWEQIATLDRMGFEIGNHTGHHIAVRNLPREKLIEEIEFIEQRCAAHNIRPPETFCYPGGVEDPGAFAVAAIALTGRIAIILCSSQVMSLRETKKPVSRTLFRRPATERWWCSRFTACPITIIRGWILHPKSLNG